MDSLAFSAEGSENGILDSNQRNRINSSWIPWFSRFEIPKNDTLYSDPKEQNQYLIDSLGFYVVKFKKIAFWIQIQRTPSQFLVDSLLFYVSRFKKNGILDSKIERNEINPPWILAFSV